MAKRGVRPAEAESVVRDARRPWPRQVGNGKWIVVGRGQGERVIEVIYVDHDDATFFIIHAMPLTTRRRK